MFFFVYVTTADIEIADDEIENENYDCVYLNEKKVFMEMFKYLFLARKW